MAYETFIQPVINGQSHALSVPTTEVLARTLRDRLGLTGVKLSCGLQICGSCTVLVDGRPVSSCTLLAAETDGRTVLTVEGLVSGATLHPLQRAFVEKGAVQCGFCTSGFLLSALALLNENPDPDEKCVRHYLRGNICRCTGYRPIVEAVLQAAAELRG